MRLVLQSFIYFFCLCTISMKGLTYVIFYERFFHYYSFGCRVSSSSESRPLEVDKPRKESIFEFEEETLNFCQKTRKGVLEKEEGVFDDFPTHWMKERNYETIFCSIEELQKREKREGCGSSCTNKK